MSDIQVYADTGSGSSTAKGQYRPANWTDQPQVMLTIAAQYAQTLGFQPSTPPSTQAIDTQGTQNASPVPAPPNAVPIFLVFDGIESTGHSQTMTATEHPIQDSANQSDHIRANQARVSLNVVMTDVLPAYADGQWIGNASKSIACFETLDTLRLGRIPMTLTTRLKTYTNVFIMDVHPEETVRTLYGFRGRIEFKQLNLSSIATMTVSARSQTTDGTNLGQVNPQPVTAGVQSQNGLPSTATGAPSSDALQATSGTVIGAGNYSSNNTSSIATGSSN